MKTPVQPPSAISRIKLGSSVTSIETAALQIFSSGPQLTAQRAEVVGPRAEIVVDEYRIRLAVPLELLGDLARVAHPIRHP
jgi:hypothetical protein